MSLKRLFDAGTLASIPWVAEFATRFGRSVILARCLAPNEFGIAVALNVLLTTSLMIGDLGIDKFLMSRPPGKDEETLAATHALHLGKGLLVAALVFAVAPWFARLFGALEATASFRWCAAIVVIHALAHLEIKQAQRDFRYLPNVKAVLASRFAAIGVVYPAVLVFHDNRAMIASLLVSGVVSTCASHLLARTPYRLSFRDRRILWQAVSYVLPLTVNGVALAAKFQFDRAAVGYWLGLTTLAAFAVILNLAAAPISVALGILANLGIPFLTQARAASGARDDAYPALVWVYGVLAAAYASFVAATLDKLVPFIFGPTYQVGPLTQLLISLIAWVRLSRGAPTLLLLVEVDTRRLLTAKSCLGERARVGCGAAAGLAASRDRSWRDPLRGSLVALLLSAGCEAPHGRAVSGCASGAMLVDRAGDDDSRRGWLRAGARPRGAARHFRHRRGDHRRACAVRLSPLFSAQRIAGDFYVTA